MYAEYPQLSQPDDQYPTNPEATAVNVPQTQTITYVADVAPEKWSWCNLVTSIFAFFCCTFCGFLAVIMAVLSYVDHKAKDYARSKSKRNAAWGLAITAIVIGVIVVLGIAVMAVVWIATLASTMQTFREQLMEGKEEDSDNQNLYGGYGNN